GLDPPPGIQLHRGGQVRLRKPAGNAGIANTSPTAGARTAELPLPREGLKGNPGGGLAHGWAAPVPALEWRGADGTPAMASRPARTRLPEHGHTPHAGGGSAAGWADPGRMPDPLPDNPRPC